VLGAAASVALACLLVAALTFEATRAENVKHAAELHTPQQVHSDGYVSSAQCRSCHPSEYASWRNSYHRSMTQLATSESVIGSFDNVTLSSAGLEYRLERDHDHFFATALNADEPSAPRPVTLLTGSHYMQIYWFETGDGRRLGQLPFVFLNADQRWVPRNAIFIEPPRPLRAGATGRWNASCIACHTTFGQPRIDASGTFDTRVAEFGIACEACHGPGETHVQHNRSPLARYLQHFGEHTKDIVEPHELSHVRSSLVCGQCHATWLHDGPRGMRRWNEHGFAYRPGGDPADTMLLMRPSIATSDPRVADVVTHEPQLVEGQFWNDGEVRVSGREFNGMVDSACYARGELSCLSCHRLHQSPADPRAPKTWADAQLAENMNGDGACLQCHTKLKTTLTAHTHHAPRSEGSRCYNCHMPFTSYGLLKSMRSHHIDVPNVAASAATGRPNACNLCHLDKSLGWTARSLQQWYGREAPPLDDDQREVPSALLLGLTGDAGQRALIAWALGWQPAQAASKLTAASTLLGILRDDPYDAVRYIATRSLREQISSAAGPPLSGTERRTVDRLHALRNDRPIQLLE
jgi:hypothetical protein